MPSGSKGRQTTASPASLVVGGLAQFAVATAIWAALLFGAAGTVCWVRGWIHLALWPATFGLNGAVLWRCNRDVIAARLRPKRGTEGPDAILLAAFLPATLAIPVVAGLDAVRYGWAPLPLWTLYPGLLLHAAGDALVLWSMAVNPHLEKTLRIQVERDHRVITTGPYALVRHPMYAGLVLILAGMPLVLGSAWTFVPVGAMAALLVARTLVEERMLRDRLPGYEEYARRTRYRLVPGIW